MANQNLPCGAVPHERALRTRRYQAGAAIYPGDFVSLNSSGQVVIATATAALVGVAMSYAAVSGADVLIADHPDQLFKVTASGTNPSAQTDLNLNYDIIASSPSTVFKCSRMRMDSTSGATTATLPLKLLAVDVRPNNALGANADCVVKINNHQLAGGTGTAGV